MRTDTGSVTDKLPLASEGEAAAEKKAELWKSVSLSVVVPAYNLENYIGECLDSIFSQSIERMEVLVVNDASRDKTADILKEYAAGHEELRVITFEKNKGVSAARNAALDAARGEYIHFCDGDDLVPKGAYKELLQVAAEEDADIVTGNYSRRYSAENNAIRPFSNYQAETGIERCFESGNTTLWNKLFRRSFIEALHLRFDETMHFHEDYLFYSLVLRAEPKAAFTDKNVYIYTDPGEHKCEGYKSKIRYANLEYAEAFHKAWKEIFSCPIRSNQKEWINAFQWNLSWFYTYSWQYIQDPEEKQKAYDLMKELLFWSQEEVTICDWNSDRYTQAFINIFGVDYPSFLSMPYETYMMTTGLKKPVTPRWTNAQVTRKIEKLPRKDADTLLRQSITQQLDSLRAAYAAASFSVNEQVWQNNYWNVIDALVNDNWRLIQDPALKKGCFKAIFRVVKELAAQNSLCDLETPGEIERFRYIFCVDRVTLEALSYENYLLVYGLKRNEVQTGAVGGAGSGIEDINGVFINHCASGRAGMKVLIKAFKGWLRFKMQRFLKMKK